MDDTLVNISHHKIRYKIVAILIALFLLYFVSITYGKWAHSFLYGLDNTMAQYMVSIQNVTLAKWMLAFTYFGNWQVILSLQLALLVLLFFINKKSVALLTVSGLIAGEFFSLIIKTLSQRARPDYFNYLSMTGNDSFPSGHALVAVVFYGLCAYIVSKYLGKNWQKRGVFVVAGLIALAIGFSRMYLGVHWFSDVVGGWILGLVILISIVSVFQHLKIGIEKSHDDKAHRVNLLLIVLLIICEGFFIYHFYTAHPLVVPSETLNTFTV